MEIKIKNKMTVKNITKKYDEISNQDVKELAEDLNLNEQLAKQIELWFANTEIKNSGNNTRYTDLLNLFRKVAVDHYVGMKYTPQTGNE